MLNLIPRQFSSQKYNTESSPHQLLFQLNPIHLLGCPLETCHNTVLDLVQVLDSLTAVNEQVRSSSLWAEAPDLPGLSFVVVILLGQVTSPSLWLNPSLGLTSPWGGARRDNCEQVEGTKGGEGTSV